MRNAAVVVLSMLASCSSNEQKAYQRLADAVNPALLQLRAPAQQVAKLESEEAVVAACLSADAPLSTLHSSRERFFALTTKGGDVVEKMLPTYANAILGARGHFCREPTGQCATFCRQHWKLLADGITVIARDAAKHDVRIELLDSE